jgi:hypothetical protein
MIFLKTVYLNQIVLVNRPATPKKLYFGSVEGCLGKEINTKSIFVFAAPNDSSIVD